jgi:hypothetical protein
MRERAVRRTTVRWLSLVAIGGLGAGAIAVGGASSGITATKAAAAKQCPPGFVLAGRSTAERSLAAYLSAGSAGVELSKALDRAAPTASSQLCLNRKHPESPTDFMAMAAQRATAKLAPLSRAPKGAMRAAYADREAMLRSGRIQAATGKWKPLGTTPLVADDPAYDEVNGEGLGDLAGRIDSLDYDKRHARLFASVGTGGVWMSTSNGRHWRSVSNKLPTQFVGAVGWSRARGGTLITAGGEPLMGGDTYSGLGAYWTSNLGKKWHHAKGIRDGLQTFQVAVNKAKPRIVYVATSHGLYRSHNAGRSYKNVALPTTKKCAGKSGWGRCEMANWVTDVVVRPPGGTTKGKGGAVLAAVGFRAGTQAEYPNGKKQAPGNGLYRSPNGRPGTFKLLNVSGDGNSPVGFAPRERIGRTEMGVAEGPKQNHDIVYAIVEDAALFNGGVPGIDAPGDPQAGLPNNTALNGVYYSPDFGSSWIRLADDNELSNNPGTGSALAGTGSAQLYAPGVQAWYNEWIKPDPTRQDANGVPTRLAFGLEEVWTNRLDEPQDETEAANEDSYKVVGPYFAGDTCLFLDLGLPYCPTTGSTPDTRTTHPDQHDAIWIPSGQGGGVDLVVGNDGGAYVQHLGTDQDLTNENWGRGNQDGFHTLLAYDVAVSNDGTLYYGLQDNGHAKMTPDGSQYMVFGGDAFFAAVDPHNSNYAWEEYTSATMSVTTDGGRTWRDASPTIDGAGFSNPFVMDPTNPNHLLTAGQQVVETIAGPQTGNSGDWTEVYDLGSDFTQSTVQTRGNASYVGYCSNCDFYPSGFQLFTSGIATNVGGSQPPMQMTSQGWHKAAAKGLPERFVTSIAIDPKDKKTVYVALGGYANREWAPAGSYLDKHKKLGHGHVFVSHDAGKHFRDITFNLPNTEASFVGIHGKHLVVGTDVGAFISKNRKGTRWSVLGGRSMPAVPVTAIRTFPGARGELRGEFRGLVAVAPWTRLAAQGHRLRRRRQRMPGARPVGVRHPRH